MTQESILLPQFESMYFRCCRRAWWIRSTERLAAYGKAARDSIDLAAGFGDAGTADLFTEVSRAIDKQLWFVEAHLQAER